MRAAGLLAPAFLAALLAAGQVGARCEDYVPEARPQNASRDIVGRTLDEILASGFINFAVYEDFPPYSWQADGKPRGIDVELGRIVADALGVAPRFRFVAAGDNLDADLRNYVWQGSVLVGRVSDVMLHVPYDTELTCRIEQVVLTGQYFNERIAIAFRRDAYPDDPPIPAYFRFDPVGVENDSLADFYLATFANGQLLPNIRRYPTPSAAMAALAAGEVKAVMGARAQLEQALTPTLALSEAPLPGLGRGEWTVGVAVQQGHRDLAYAVDDVIRVAVDDGRLAAVFAARGLSFVQPDW